jgi:DNA excision repair protein ERCC-5
MPTHVFLAKGYSRRKTHFHFFIKLKNYNKGLDRDALIAIALLVGSDYTTGIENVGIVKAVETLQEFDGIDGFEKLKNFKYSSTIF